MLLIDRRTHRVPARALHSPNSAAARGSAPVWAMDCTGKPERHACLRADTESHPMNHRTIAVLALAILAACPSAAFANPSGEASAAFPLRPQYIDVAVLETAELHARFHEVIVVDVRSQYEYDTLRIREALLLPVTESRFIEEVRRLRASSVKPIVFYCNGKTCRKSYDAALKAQSARIPGVYCHDAGVFDWAKAHPELTALLRKSPMNPDALIDSERFKARLLSPRDFAILAQGDSLILDVRDRAQRDNPLFPSASCARSSTRLSRSTRRSSGPSAKTKRCSSMMPSASRFSGCSTTSKRGA